MTTTDLLDTMQTRPVSLIESRPSRPIIRQDMMSSSPLHTFMLVLLSFTLSGFDVSAARAVEILPHWKKGEVFSLHISRAREKFADGTSTISGKTRTDFRLEVLHADERGYLIGWTAGDTTFDVPPSSESFLRQVVGLMKDMRIVLQIDPHGTITGVQNWKELRKEVLKVMDALLANTPDTEAEAANRTLLSNVRTQWDTTFSTKEQIEQLCTRDAKIYLMALGRSYEFNKPHDYPDQLSNPLGGEPFPARTTIALKAFDQLSGQVTLVRNQRTDPQHATRILESMVNEMSARQGKKLPEGTFAKTIAIEDHADIIVDVRTGWVTTLTRVQSVHLGTRGQTDTTTIVRSAR